VARSLEA
jgi:hypothetical protein